MKKYFAILITSGFILASCGGKTTTPQETPADTTETTEASTTPTTTTTSEEGTATTPTDTETTSIEDVVSTVSEDATQALAKYKEFVDKFEKVVAGVNKGDAKSVVEYSKLLKEVPAISKLAQDAAKNFTEEQKTEYTKLAKKYADIVKGMTQKK